MNVRKMKPEDYDDVSVLWNECGFVLGISDSREEIGKFLNYNPHTSLILTLNHNIVGSVLGGYDGRRGLIHHLAVLPVYQEQGYGEKLITSLEAEFAKLGVIKTSFWVLKSNMKVVGFYEKMGYVLRDDLFTLSKLY